MTRVNNPFITSGYISADYFCDREIESKQLIREIVNGNNLAIISTRRMGKTGLIQHCFHSKELSKEYYTFFVDIYATKSLRDFIFSLSKVILESLKPFGKKAVEIFINSVLSLQAGISYDFTGTPSFNIQLGDIQNSMATLEEIFKYLAKADRCPQGDDRCGSGRGRKYFERDIRVFRLVRETVLRCHRRISADNELFRKECRSSASNTHPALQQCPIYFRGKPTSYNGEYVPERIPPVLSECLHDAPREYRYRKIH